MIPRRAWFFLGALPDLVGCQQVFKEIDALQVSGDRLVWKISVTTGAAVISALAGAASVWLEHTVLAQAAILSLWVAWSTKNLLMEKLTKIFLRTEYLRGYSGAKAGAPP